MRRGARSCAIEPGFVSMEPDESISRRRLESWTCWDESAVTMIRVRFSLHVLGITRRIVL